MKHRVWEQMFRRFIALCLSFCMIFTYVDITAWAEMMDSFSEETVIFQLDGVEVERALLEVDQVSDSYGLGNNLEDEMLKGRYKQLFKESDVREIFPNYQIHSERQVDSVQMRVFVKSVSEEQPELIVLYLNESQEDIWAVVEIDGKQTQPVFVETSFIEIATESNATKSDGLKETVGENRDLATNVWPPILVENTYCARAITFSLPFILKRK